MRIGVFVVVLSLVFVGVTPADQPEAGKSQGPAEQAPAGGAIRADEVAGPHETVGDAQVPVSREQRATSRLAPVVRGPYRSVQVNVDAAGNDILGDAANEPSLAIDPTNPDNIVIGWRQFDTITSNFRQAGVAYSHDGGQTWTFPGVLQPGQFRSDPVLAADSQGTFFYYSLSTTTNAEMFISTDKGVNWIGPISAFGGDKTWMCTDTTGGIGDSNLYTLWNSQFTCCAPGTDFTRSTDGGQSYDGPYSTPVKPKWGTVDVGPDGAVHYVGTRVYPTTSSEHLLLTSFNAQNSGTTPTFDQTTGITLGGSTAVNGTPNPGGLLGQVWVAVDRSGGPRNGNVYVLASVDPPGADPLDVNFVRSADGGATFTGPRRIHEPIPGAWQWFGTMSVAPNGRIDAVWNDTRSDPSGRISEVYYAYSTDAGDTWSKGVPVTPAFNSVIGHPNQNKIGDYYHMVSDAAGAGLAYSATFSGGQDVFYLRVGDCNTNGRHDADDIGGATSADCDFNGIPDECQDVAACLGCDNDGLCDRGESCTSCPADCASSGFPGCGNGICELGLNENCLTCPADCNGLQKGRPADQYCCGAAGGTNPVNCSDARCTTGGFQCSSTFAPVSCCGDDFCEGLETSATCFADCAVGVPGEASRPAVPAAQLRVTSYNRQTGVLSIAYSPACDATQHTIYSGALAGVASYSYDGAACNVGASGAASFDPGGGDRFFLIVGNDSTREGSYGADSAGALRPEDIDTLGCNLPHPTTGVTCQ